MKYQERELRRVIYSFKSVQKDHFYGMDYKLTNVERGM